MWQRQHYYRFLETQVEANALWMFERVFRTDFERPGVALLACGDVDTIELRSLMLELKTRLAHCYRESMGRRLVALSVGRFNQQATTKFHLDGAPDEAFLMLGYEPTPVQSRLAISDYSRAAFDLGTTPREFLESFNPMYADHAARLTPYVTPLEGYNLNGAFIALFNNSSQPFVAGSRNMLGVMHQVTVPQKVPGASRTVNTMMLAGAGEGADEPVDAATVAWFRHTDEITSYSAT